MPIALAWAAFIVCSPLAGVAHAVTKVTRYTYNADGALTAVTTRLGDGQPETRYLVWDDFKPSASDPTTGTVSVGNGDPWSASAPARTT